MKPVCPDSITFHVPGACAEALEEFLANGDILGLGTLSSTGASNEGNRNRCSDADQAVIEHTGATRESEPLDVSLTYSSSASTINSLLTDPGRIPQKPSHQRPPRRYPQEVYNGTINSSHEGTASKWVQWCVGSRRTRLREICVQGPSGAKSGRKFLQELKSIYKQLRGFRYWFCLTTLTRVKLVKVRED
jgi:hypothetical protein